MNISQNYLRLVFELSDFDFFENPEKQLIACLIVSQTEKRYRQFIIFVLQRLENLNPKSLVESWQGNNFQIIDSDFKNYFSKKEFTLLEKLDLEDHLEKYESEFPDLFHDGFENAFYPTKKKGMAYWRRLAKIYLQNYKDLNKLQKLILHFCMAQALVSWESSCIHLGLMILENWEINQISENFVKVWPIYRNEN